MNKRKFFNKACSFLAEYDYNSAIDIFNQMILLDYDNSILHYLRAKANNNIGNYTKAIEGHNEAMKLNPLLSLLCYEGKAFSYKRQGDFDKEIECYQEKQNILNKIRADYLNKQCAFIA